MKKFKQLIESIIKDDTIPNGTMKWFEYHCLESDDSADAKLWYRSHTRVEVLKDVSDPLVPKTRKEREKEGMPRAYQVKFSDGYIGDVLEDELMDSQKEFFRPDPPKKD